MTEPRVGMSIGRPDYGLDAPGVVGQMALAGLIGFGFGVTGRLLTGWRVFDWALWFGASWLLTAAGMVWSSRVGKLRVAGHLLDSLPWTGAERVLDVGCGRGLLLIGAAQRLRTGSAVGVDIWREGDQAGNHPRATQAHAAAAGVGGRVCLVTGDARALPFAEGAFHIVLSGLTLHNIGRREERAQALAELVRVLKPGGHLGLFDILRTGEYVRILTDLGLKEVRRSRPYFLFWLPTYMITARKASPTRAQSTSFSTWRL